MNCLYPPLPAHLPNIFFAALLQLLGLTVGGKPVYHSNPPQPPPSTRPPLLSVSHPTRAAQTGRTGLIQAASTGQFEVVRRLCQSGADVNAQSLVGSRAHFCLCVCVFESVSVPAYLHARGGCVWG